MIERYIQLLKQAIIKSNCPYVKIENNFLIYELGNGRIERDISSYTSSTLGELGRALAVLDLILNKKIPPEKILIEASSPVGSPSKRLDIIIKIDNVYNERKCIALVECKTSTKMLSDEEFVNYFKRQLFNIAHSYAKDANQPYPLILIAYEVYFTDNNNYKIFYLWFSYPEILKTLDTGQIPLEKIINRNSIFANTTPPRIDKENNKVYFYRPYLRKEDLIEITDPNQLKRLLKETIHQKLRSYGIVENDAFNVIINLLLAKIYDEIELFSNKRDYPHFQVMEDDYIKPQELYRRIKNLLVNARINLLGEAPKDAQKIEVINHEQKEKILLEIVPYFQRLKIRSLRFIGEDTMGDVFLDFMHSIYRQSRGTFFTHPNICRFVVKALNVKKVREYLEKGEYKYVLDPTCGSGTFLIEALRVIFKDYPIDKIQEDAIKVLFGMDNNKEVLPLAKVNMVIHGGRSGSLYLVRDSLDPLESLPLPFISSSKISRDYECTPECIKEGEGVDYILTNPPFSLEVRQDEYPHFRIKDFLTFKKGVTEASECLFIERWFQLMNPNGRLGAVLPFSIIESVEFFKPRLLLLCYFKIVAIVGLPEHAFSPFAQQPTILLFAKRRPIEESEKLFKLLKNERIEEFINLLGDEKIIFYEASNVGFKRQKKRKAVLTIETDKNDLTDEIADIISRAFEDIYPENISIKDMVVLSIREIYKRSKTLSLSPLFHLSFTHSKDENEPIFVLKDEWEIVKVDKKVFSSPSDIDNVLICETGDISEGGSGIILPKNLKHTTPSNLERIKRKIESGKFGYLRPGDIIIAPVRVYQRKIAVVTPESSKFLYSKDFIVLRKKGEPDIIKSFEVFLSLVHPKNIKMLESLSTKGKKGYPKITNPSKILELPFYKVEVSREEIINYINIYDSLYRIMTKSLSENISN